VDVFGEELEFGLEEVVERSDHTPTAAERRQKTSPWYDPWPRYDFTPTGRLVLRVRNHWSRAVRLSWADGRQQRVENCLNNFVGSLLKASEEMRVRRLEVERRQQQWETDRQRQAELERQRAEEEARLQQLLRESENWHKSQLIRAYVEAVRVGVVGEIAIGSELDGWLRWATQKADELNPVDRLTGSQGGKAKL
jgi:hypothetical protein